MRYIYVAGPYTTGDPEANTNMAIDDANLLMSAGYVPFVPHLSHFWHLRHERPYEEWLDWCFAWVDRCDAVYRRNGTSPGGDAEVERAMRNDKPVYFGPRGLEALIELADTTHPIWTDKYAVEGVTHG